MRRNDKEWAHCVRRNDKEWAHCVRRNDKEWAHCMRSRALRQKAVIFMLFVQTITIIEVVCPLRSLRDCGDRGLPLTERVQLWR